MGKTMKYYVKVAGDCSHVRTEDDFIRNYGLTESWGETWIPIEAETASEALKNYYEIESISSILKFNGKIDIKNGGYYPTENKPDPEIIDSKTISYAVYQKS